LQSDVEDSVRNLGGACDVEVFGASAWTKK
jgi:hypothetical protein